MALQSILAATDFSTDGQHAVQRAAIICASAGVPHGAVLHVLESSWLERLRHLVALPPAVDESLHAAARQSLDALTAAIRARSGVTLEGQVRVGTIVETILAAAAQADLLVLGARGRHPLRDFVVGSTAERILRQAATPVLIVRRAPAHAYRRVLVAVDFSAHSRQALVRAGAIAPAAELHLAHIVGGLFEGRMRDAGVGDELIHEYTRRARAEADEAMQQFVAAAGVDRARVRPLVDQGPHVPSSLLDKARTLDADLVVVGKRGTSLVDNLLLGSITLHVVMQSHCDVLVAQ